MQFQNRVIYIQEVHESRVTLPTPRGRDRQPGSRAENRERDDHGDPLESCQ